MAVGMMVADRQFDTRFDENMFIGMNDRLPSHQLPKGVFTLIDNALVSDNKIVKRFGNTGSTAIAGNYSMNGSIAFERSNGSKSQIICVNGALGASLYESTNGITFSAISSDEFDLNTPMNFVIASDKVLGFNGIDCFVYTGDGAAISLDPATVPIGKFAFWFHNYLFVAGVFGAYNRLYWSDLGDPTSFTSSNFVDINANDGDSITGLSAFNDELVIFKNNSIWTITGFSGSTFDATTVAGQNTNSRVYGFGTPSHRSIVAAGQNLYYLSFAGGIPHIRMLNRTMFGNILDGGIVSYEIEGTMRGLNYSQLQLATGIYDGKYVYWALPSGSNTYNDVVIQMWHDKTFTTNQGIMRSWVKHTSGYTVDNFFLSSISGKVKIYWSDSSTSGKVFVFDTSVYTDDGVAITMDVRTRDFMGDPVRQTKWKYVPIKFATDSSGTLQVNARVDQSTTFGNQRNILLQDNILGLGDFILGTSILGGAETIRNFVTLQHMTGTLLGLQFKEATGHGTTIYDYQILGNRKGMRTNL